MTLTKQKSVTVTARQYEVLVLLSRSRSCSVGQIASALGISSAAATKIVIRLEKKGLVVRRVNEMDRRVINVSLTRAGTESIQLFDPLRLMTGMGSKGVPT